MARCCSREYLMQKMKNPQHEALCQNRMVGKLCERTDSFFASSSNLLSSNSSDDRISLQKAGLGENHELTRCETGRGLLCKSITSGDNRHVISSSWKSSSANSGDDNRFSVEVDPKLTRAATRCEADRQCERNGAMTRHNDKVITQARLNIVESGALETLPTQSQNKLVKTCGKTRPVVNKIYRCKRCSRSFTQKDNFDRHQQIHSKKPTGRLAPKYSIINSSSLRLSYGTALPPIQAAQKVYKCDYCEKLCTHIQSLTAHMKSHTAKSYVCQICTKAFGTNGSLKKHMCIHTREKVLNCSICRKSFPTKVTLTAHMRTHTEKRPDKSKLSGKTSTTSSFRKKHTSQNRVAYPCSICVKSFTSAQRLIKHIKSHIEKESFRMCQVCGQFFSNNSLLYLHMKIHTKGKKYHCRICFEEFTNAALLSEHVRTHVDKKCQVCGQCCFGDADFAVHMRIHCSDQNHKCTICEKLFSNGNDLYRHLITHTGEQNLRCGICDEHFAIMDDLNEHMLTHVEDKIEKPNMLVVEVELLPPKN